MNYLIENFGIVKGWGLATLFFTLRYVLPAGLVYTFFYVYKRRAFLIKKIQQKFPSNAKIREEIQHSLFATLILSSLGLVLYLVDFKSFSKIYLDINAYPLVYLPISFVLLVFIQDTYFYWTHRLMHLPKVYRIVHRTHHGSTNPTPWAIFNFHPLEVLLEYAVLPVLLLLIPVHISVLAVFILWLIGFNLLGHLGFEIFPAWFLKHPVTKWLNTSTHHNMHHQLVGCNYGLYFNFWDTWMGTNHKAYKQRFEEIHSRKLEA